MYICEYCNYETDDKSGFSHHNKTKKHLKNKENVNKKNIEEKQIIENQYKEIKELKQEITKLEVESKIYKELSNKGKNINNGIIINNNLSYVNKHYKNAPPLKKISNFILNGIDLNDDTQLDKLTEKIIYSYNNKCLHKLIGDHIIENYKKDDLQLQSFHAIDIARRKYLVKLEDNLGFLYDESSEEIDHYNPENDNDNDVFDSETNNDNDNKEIKNKIQVKKKKSKWTSDNEGVKISYLLCEPVIRKIIRQLKKNCRNYNIEVKENTKKIPTMDTIKKFQILTNILKEIDKDKLNKNINNYIAPHFGIIKK
jgi:hypothetical protein